MDKIDKLLDKFQSEHSISGKGALAVMLVITRHAKEHGLPLKADNLITEEKGQVLGLGKSAVQAILEEHGITRVLAEEGGRTSRGSIGHMRRYVDFLNDLKSKGLADLDRIEKWWIERVGEYFSSKGFTLHYDPSKSLRFIVEDLLGQAFKRQRSASGTTYAGAMLQHMVGAKLDLVLEGQKIEHRGHAAYDPMGGAQSGDKPDHKVKHRGYSVSDGSTQQDGDFLVDDVVIHVTTAPSEGLIRKCKKNLDSALRPMIVTPARGVAGASSLAEVAGIAQRIDIIEAGQFIATNLYELSLFKASRRKLTVERFVEKYNEIVSSCETDPGLKICVGK